MIEIILVITCCVIIGLLIEKLCHPDYDMTGLTLVLKADVIKFITALVSSPVIRYTFDFAFKNDLITLVEPHAQKEFDTKVNLAIFRRVPTICISFVPERRLDESELLNLMNLMKKKFQEHLSIYDLNWDFFVTYSIGNNVSILLHYCEHEVDEIPFNKLYVCTVNNKTEKSSGILIDEDLDEELHNVD